ncbi:MarR family winged helix-turn-helix transcriptional regulator [Defluviimonas sp. WL0050]|uniref:MarR family winged helix-turn-helix transcriptional regulator n=1 Tax=Albidovulum litorale TaxID=2984134 RepID=A0ABT2ZRT7_9RHOB|nr:MarR family winged helix-turn-helix transcriptional regulator [Defluviimonas sp. WL0050]MCV2873872.1 MarR family winged helix-turn-helix transcriptional regulator [Defluviimonas sp. WL0050]
MKDLHKIIWQTRPLLQQIETAVAAGLDGTGLTVRMRAVLEILFSDGPMTVPALARHLSIQRQYVQIMVNETEAAGFTTRHPNPAHKASHLVDLTEAGRDAIGKALTREAEIVSRIARQFDPADIAAAKRVSDGLISAFRQINGEEPA